MAVKRFRHLGRQSRRHATGLRPGSALPGVSTHVRSQNIRMASRKKPCRGEEPFTSERRCPTEEGMGLVGRLVLTAVLLAGCRSGGRSDRVVVLGIDGLDPDVVDLLASE